MGKGESPGGWGRRGVGDALEDSQGCLTQFQTSAERLLGPGWLGLAGGFSGAGKGGGKGILRASVVRHVNTRGWC